MSTNPKVELPPFAEAWAKKEAEGFRYNGDALENVAFGYAIAQDELASLSTHKAAPVSDGVVERARELLATEYEAVDMPAAAEVVRVCPRFNEQGPYGPALRAIERALKASGLDEAIEALERIVANAKTMAADPEQSKSSRGWWRICEDDASTALTGLQSGDRA